MRLLTIFLLFILLQLQSRAQVITTVAGTGTSGYSGDGGAAAFAQIKGATDVHPTPDGGFVIADFQNMRIRKVSAGGVISTIAGNGTATISGDGGPATAAGIGNYGLCIHVDPAGNIYIPQPGAIRKIDPAGIITTIAGTGVPGFSSDGSPATASQIGAVEGIATDASGDVYFSETNGYRVRKISGGILTTVAGVAYAADTGDGGPATLAAIRPIGIAFDGAGNLYINVAHGGSSPYSYIRKVNTAGIITTIAGAGAPGYSGDGGPAMAAAISFTGGIRTDATGNIYFPDKSHHIRKINTAGIITTIAGTGVAGYSGEGCSPVDAQLNYPRNVAVDGSGNIIFPDYSNYRIRRIWAGNTPAFTGGAAQYLSACQSVAAPVNTLLSVADADAAQPLSWAVLQAPAHGVLSAAYSGVSGGTVTPSGLSYTASAGYTGPDTFSVVVTDCADAADTTVVYVTVADTPVAATLTGADTVCEGSTTTIVAGTGGGTWISSNTARATVSAGGVVTGVTTGTVVLTYTTANACGSAAATHAMVVKPAGTCVAGISGLYADERPRIWPNPANDGTLHLHLPAIDGAVIISVTGTDGRVMHHGAHSSGGEFTIQLPAGMYVVQVTTAASVTNEVVVVQ